MRDWAERVGWVATVLGAVAAFLLALLGIISLTVYLLSIVL